jgi:hypothetical protein
MTEFDGIEFPDEEPKEIKVNFKDRQNEEYFKRLDKEYEELFGSGNNAGQAEQELDICKEKLSKQDIDFAIETMTKEAKHDRISIKQLFHGYNSGFTKAVIHGNLNSKNAGAGKSYLLNKVADYYPDKHVLILTGVSDKAFQHMEGTMVVEDKDTGELTEAEPIINKLRLDIVDLEQKIEDEKLKEKKDKSLIKELKEQILAKEQEIKSIQDHQIKLINLGNTIILLLDTPQDAVTDNLMSVLSNDTTRDQKYLFTDKSASGKLGSKYNILGGTPVMFTTRVIDDTRNVRFEEKNRRFVNITPNVSPEKIEDANTLMWEECGLTPEQYDQTVVSREDKERVKRIVSILVAKLKDHSKYLKPKQFGVKIPFIYSIKIPSNDVWAMTAIDRMRRYLAIITKENMDTRPRLVRKDNPKIFLPISTFEDLKETLELMEIAGSNVRPYLAQWYNSVFLPLLNDEGGKVRTRIENIGEKSEKTLQEEYVAVTSKQLCKKTGIGNEELRHKYIDPLINQGIINKTRSNIRKSENIHWAADSKGQNIFTLFEGGDFKLHVEDPERYPTKSFIVNSFIIFGEKSGDKTGGIFEKNILDTYRLEDADGTEITPEELADRYFSDPETCFGKKFKNSGSLVAEYSAECFQSDTKTEGD